MNDDVPIPIARKLCAVCAKPLADDASAEANIKAVYRRLAKQHHPDAAGGDAGRFRALHEAYEEALRDADKRVDDQEWGRRCADCAARTQDQGPRVSARPRA